MEDGRESRTRPLLYFVKEGAFYPLGSSPREGALVTFFIALLGAERIAELYVSFAAVPTDPAGELKEGAISQDTCLSPDINLSTLRTLEEGNAS